MAVERVYEIAGKRREGQAFQVAFLGLGDERQVGLVVAQRVEISFFGKRRSGRRLGVPADLAAMAPLFVEAGADMLNVSVGTCESGTIKQLHCSYPGFCSFGVLLYR